MPDHCAVYNAHQQQYTLRQETIETTLPHRILLKICHRALVHTYAALYNECPTKECNIADSNICA